MIYLKMLMNFQRIEQHFGYMPLLHDVESKRKNYSLTIANQNHYT